MEPAFVPQVLSETDTQNFDAYEEISPDDPLMALISNSSSRGLGHSVEREGGKHSNQTRIPKSFPIQNELRDDDPSHFRGYTFMGAEDF